MKNFILGLVLVSCITLNGCFPTGEIEESNIQNSLNNTELNISPREGLIYNLSIPDEYKETYSAAKCRFKQIDSSIAEELFQKCTVDTETVLDRPEEQNYKLFQKKDSWVCFQDGRILKWQQHDIQSTFLMHVFSMAKPYWMIREEFPQTDMDSISISDCTNEMDRIINTIGVDVGKPKIFPVTKKIAKDIGKKYYPDSMSMIGNITDEDCCIIRYDMLLNELPIVNCSYRVISGTQEWIPQSCSVSGLFNKDGLLEFQCEYILDDIETEEPEQLCTAEYAIAQMKNYIEKTTRNGTLYGCEQGVLVYRKKEKFSGEYYARPVWVFGWAEENEGQQPDPYYVDAINGHIL